MLDKGDIHLYNEKYMKSRLCSSLIKIFIGYSFFEYGLLIEMQVFP